MHVAAFTRSVQHATAHNRKNPMIFLMLNSSAGYRAATLNRAVMNFDQVSIYFSQGSNVRRIHAYHLFSLPPTELAKGFRWGRVERELLWSTSTFNLIYHSLNKLRRHNFLRILYMITAQCENPTSAHG